MNVKVEQASQRIVTEHMVHKGYELIEHKQEKDGFIYLLGKEIGENIHVKVVKDGKITFEKEWKKTDLIRLEMIQNALSAQLK